MLVFRNIARSIGICFTMAALLTACSQDRELFTEKTATDTRLAKVEAELASFRDQNDIRDVYVRYGHGIDRLDEEAYRSAFWPDAQINYGTTESISVDGHWNGHMLKFFKENGKAWGHLFNNIAIDVSGDVAHVEVYLTVLYVPKDNKSGLRNLWAGRYIDRVDRRNGEWRIAVREFIPHFVMNVDTTPFDGWNEAYKDVNTKCAREGKRDTSYVRPLNRRSVSDGTPCAG